MELPTGTFSRFSFKRKSSKRINQNKGEQHWRKVFQARGQTNNQRRNGQQEEKHSDDVTAVNSDQEVKENKPVPTDVCDLSATTSSTPLSASSSSSTSSSSTSSSSTFFKRMSAWLNSRRKITSRSLRRRVDKRPHLGHMRLRRAKGFDLPEDLPEESTERVVGRTYVRVQESNGLEFPCDRESKCSPPRTESASKSSHLFSHNRIIVTESDDPNYVFIHNKFSEQVCDRREHGSPGRTRSSLFDQKKKRDMFLAVPMDASQMPRPEVRERTPEEKRLPLTATASCPARSPTASETDLSIDVIKRSWSWPYQKQRMDERGTDDIHVSDFRRSRFNSSMDKTERFEDLSIPFRDVEFGECIRGGRNCTIYRGRWHGDVSIHYFKSLTPADSSDIWNVVTKLHWVRHENVALFMGVCLEGDNMAVVLSFQDGISMYEHIHIKNEKMPLQARVDLIRQEDVTVNSRTSEVTHILNVYRGRYYYFGCMDKKHAEYKVGYGMGYLHSRDIIHRRLNTRNVFLCPTVRISVMDYAITDKKYDRQEYACLYRGELTYIAPEVLSTMKVVPPSFVPGAPYTMESDVYAFGTLVYEFLSGKHPFHQHAPEAIIWQVCSRLRPPLNFRNKTRTLQMLIEKCWSHDSRSRPTFQAINKDLYKKTFLHRQHSCSESDLLMRCGPTGRGFF